MIHKISHSKAVRPRPVGGIDNSTDANQSQHARFSRGMAPTTANEPVQYSPLGIIASHSTLPFTNRST